jgi:MYXO-CTERM domain-containing protein
MRSLAPPRISPLVPGAAALLAALTSPPTAAASLPITSEKHEPTPEGLGWGGVARAGEPIILFTNFDGADLQGGCGNDSKNDCSTMAGEFGGEILPYPGDAGLRAAIVQAIRLDVEDFAVTVTDTRPPASSDYAMVLVGDSVYGGPEYHGFAGVAPTIDCGDSNPNQTSFALAGFVPNGMATVINQEAAHTWGLEHVNIAGDNLYPTSGGVSDPKYRDECMKIVQDTMLNPSNGYCNSVHTQFCNSSWQNSYQEMLWLFGPGVADTTAPTVTIDMPSDGAALPYPADFDLIVTLADDQTPQVMNTQILLDGVMAIGGDYAAGVLTFPIMGGISEGQHTLRVDATDEAGNPASDEVVFTVGMGAGSSTSAGSSGGGSTGGSTGGSGTSAGSTGTGTSTSTGSGSTATGDSPTTSDSGTSGTPEDSSGCGCSTQVPAPAALWATPLLVALGRRRRR